MFSNGGNNLEDAHSLDSHDNCTNPQDEISPRLLKELSVLDNRHTTMHGLSVDAHSLDSRDHCTNPQDEIRLFSTGEQDIKHLDSSFLRTNETLNITNFIPTRTDKRRERRDRLMSRLVSEGVTLTNKNKRYNANHLIAEGV